MKAWDWLREHKGVALGGAAVLLAAGSFAAGRWLAPVKTVEKTERVDVATGFASWDWTASSFWTQSAGPVHRKTTTRKAPGRPEQPPVPGPDGKPVCPACPEIDESTVEEDIGPVVSSGGQSGAGTGQAATEERHEERTERTTERAGSRVGIFATVGLPFSAAGIQPLQYGLTATATVLGPVSVLVGGSGGPAGGQATVGVGLTF